MDVRVESNDLEAMAAACKKAGRKDLTKEAAKLIRDKVKPIVPDIKSAVKATPGGTHDLRSKKARADRPRDLRDAIARGVQIKVSFSGKFAGVRLRVDPRHFPDGQKNLPKYVEGTLPRWKSPSWGRTGSGDWKTQRAHPYFFRTIEPHIPQVRAHVLKVAEETINELSRGT